MIVLAEIQFYFFKIEDPSIILSLLLGFALLVLLLWKLALPGIRTTLTDRTAKIEENQVQVDRALADIKALYSDYSSRLTQIETESRERIDAAVHEADIARTAIIDEARQSAEALKRRSEEEIARERLRYRRMLRQEIVQITLDAAEKAVRTNTSDAVQRQLIGDFIARAANGNGNGAVSGAVPAKSSVEGA